MSDYQNDPQLSTKTRFFAILRFFPGFKMILSDFETIPSDFERVSHQIQRKFKGSQPHSRPNVGDWEPSVGGYCCSRGLLLASVVGQAHCCSVVSVNNKNSVQLPTLNSSNDVSASWHLGIDHCLFLL